MSVAIIRTGSANLASVLAAFERLAVPARLTTDPRDVAEADRIVLPGVGSFGAAMAALQAADLVETLRRRIADSRPTLAICLGLQLLAESSDESPGMRGLGIIPAHITRFDERGTGRVVPQMGWNRVDAGRDANILRSGWAYYANSYKLDAIPQGWAGAMSAYGTPFVAALERGPVIACQFHPELSGSDGLALIIRWLRLPQKGTEASSIVQESDSRTPLRIIPCLDVRDGRVVKGVRFQNLRDAGDPVQQAAEYEQQGADELVMLDVSATPEGRATATKTVAEIRRVLSIPLTVGGGVRSADDAARLLDAGADKVAVNTAAVERPELLAQLAERFGRQCVSLALDAARDSSNSRWEVVARSGRERTGIDAIRWAQRAADLGAGEILLTSWDRDGTGLGYDLDLLRAITAAVRIPVIASGGAQSVEHLAAAADAGASAVLAATIFHDARTTVGRVKASLAALGKPVRLQGAPR